jgi:hypothetical protein
MSTYTSSPVTSLPLKSMAIALLFTVVLGPVGLLYASFWGGAILSILGIFIVSAQLIYPIVFLWVISCIWAARAVESYNRKLIQ